MGEHGTRWLSHRLRPELCYAPASSRRLRRPNSAWCEAGGAADRATDLCSSLLLTPRPPCARDHYSRVSPAARRRGDRVTDRAFSSWYSCTLHVRRCTEPSPKIDVKGHLRPMHAVPAPINVRCYSDSDITFRRTEVTVRAQEQTSGPCLDNMISAGATPGECASFQSQRAGCLPSRRAEYSS